MRKIYTGIDIGSDSIKIVVAEINNDSFYVLASTSRKSYGIQRGLVVEKNEVVKSLSEAINDIEKQIGVKIDKAIVAVPSNGRKLKMVSGSIKLVGDDTPITGYDVDKVMEDATLGSVEDDYDIVTVTPIVFSVDNYENILNPIGKVGKQLGLKAVIGIIPHKRLYPIVDVFNELGIEVVDVVFGSIGDYYMASTKENDKKLGAIINIGEETINVSIFNKTILIKNEIIKLGSKNIDNDIMYVYNLDYDVARYLKENFAVCSSKYADSNETFDVVLRNKENLTINQSDITKVVESRIAELLKLSKNQINNLTNRKISYIIVTGGITELKGFSTVVENVFGLDASVLNDNIVGIRNNKFSSAAGIIKYFSKKMELRDKQYSMFTKEQIDSMMKFDNSNIVLLDEASTSIDK